MSGLSNMRLAAPSAGVCRYTAICTRDSDSSMSRACLYGQMSMRPHRVVQLPDSSSHYGRSFRSPALQRNMSHQGGRVLGLAGVAEPLSVDSSLISELSPQRAFA